MGALAERRLLRHLGNTPINFGAVKSTIAAGLEALVEWPVENVVGRDLRNVVATSIHAVPHVVVPTAILLSIAAGAPVLTNVIAAPGSHRVEGIATGSNRDWREVI